MDNGSRRLIELTSLKRNHYFYTEAGARQFIENCKAQGQRAWRTGRLVDEAEVRRILSYEAQESASSA